LRESHREFQKNIEIDFKKSREEFDKWMKELKESHKEFDKWMKELRKSQKETDRQLKETIKKLDWMWVTQWDISEDMFWDNIEELFEKEWKHIENIIRNKVIQWKCEYDLIWINTSEVFVWEIKTRLTIPHIDKFLKKRLETFRENFPKYSNYKLYWFVWWRVISKDTLNYARKKWLYVMKQNNKWMTKMINSEVKEVI
jgi:hypothetical protein